MQKLKKIDGQTNVLTWFEIPVTDIDRAKKFYETILDIEMVKQADGSDEGYQKRQETVPQGNGTVVYINASPNIQTVLDKVEQAGGKVIALKTQIPAGFIAIIIDSEGNKVELHAEQ